METCEHEYGVIWCTKCGEPNPSGFKQLMSRPKTSQIVIDEFSKIVDSQDGKGFEKYQTTIDEAKDEDYDWKLMALEEAADLQKYLVKRIEELEKQKNKLIQDLAISETANQWLLNQITELKTQNKELKVANRHSVVMDLQKENLELFQENQSLKEQLQASKG